VQTHVEALPTLHALRLCHRFGHGRFKDLPIELVKMIEGYVVEPVRKKVAKDLEAASRCFRNACSILDHASRADLLWFYNKWVDETVERHPEYYDDPTDAELEECLTTGVRHYDPPDLQDLHEEAAHDRNRKKWPSLMEQIFSERNRWMFQQRFGLDIWHSFARLPYTNWNLEEYGFPQATITYLTLPNRVSRQHQWSEHDFIEDYRTESGSRIIDSNHDEVEFGTAVDICRQPSAKELAKFTQALKFLKLKVFVHNSQKLNPALKLGSSEEEEENAESDTSDDVEDSDEPDKSEGPKNSNESPKSKSAGDLNNKDDKLVLFPRPMLLSHHQIETQYIRDW